MAILRSRFPHRSLARKLKQRSGLEMGVRVSPEGAAPVLLQLREQGITRTGRESLGRRRQAPPSRVLRTGVRNGVLVNASIIRNHSQPTNEMERRRQNRRKTS